MTDDHDLLIKIENDTKWIRENFIKHCEENAADLREIKLSTDKAHKRIDWMFVSGVLSLVTLSIVLFIQ